MRVYLVESSNVFAPVLAQLIDRTSARVVGRAVDARTAIREIPALKPDVVIVGIGLAASGGFDVLKEVRAMRPKPIALVLADGTTDRGRERALRSGAAYYFDKFHDLHAWTDVLRDLSLLFHQRRLETGEARAVPMASPSSRAPTGHAPGHGSHGGDSA